MPIETIDDIIDELMDRMSIFGAHPDGIGDNCTCRCCEASRLRDRLFAAFEVHRRLNETGGESGTIGLGSPTSGGGLMEKGDQ